MTVGITVALNWQIDRTRRGETRTLPHPVCANRPIYECASGGLPLQWRPAGMMKTGKPFVMPLSSSNDDGSVTIRDPDKIDWFKPLSFVYSGPDDPRIVKTIVSGRPERL